MIVLVGGEKGGTGKTTIATNLALSGVAIRDRIAYRKAARDGLCVDELKPRDAKSLEEIEVLYAEVFDGR